MPSQRALIGFVGSSPEITFPAMSPAHALFGTCQAGLTALFCTWYSPAGVSSPTCPTATLYVFFGRRFSYTVSLNAGLLTTMYHGYLSAKLSVVTSGCTIRVCATIRREAPGVESARRTRSRR